MLDLSYMGLEFDDNSLKRSDLAADPQQQFNIWFEDAAKHYPQDANVMTLATADPNGKPTARIVLLKAYDQQGYVFYTNYDSRKGQEITANPQGALLLFWPECQRQIRIEGTLSKTAAAESDAYFATRPKISQLGAMASDQSQVIDNYAELTERFHTLQAEYATTDNIARPNNWGGYRLEPNWYEFWEGNQQRLHHRFAYTLQSDGNWLIQRLAP